MEVKINKEMLIYMAMKWLLYKIIPLLDCHIVRDMLVAII